MILLINTNNFIHSLLLLLLLLLLSVGSGIDSGIDSGVDSGVEKLNVSGIEKLVVFLCL